MSRNRASEAKRIRCTRSPARSRDQRECSPARPETAAPPRSGGAAVSDSLALDDFDDYCSVVVSMLRLFVGERRSALLFSEAVCVERNVLARLRQLARQDLLRLVGAS